MITVHFTRLSSFSRLTYFRKNFNVPLDRVNVIPAVRNNLSIRSLLKYQSAVRLYTLIQADALQFCRQPASSSTLWYRRSPTSSPDSDDTSGNGGRKPSSPSPAKNLMDFPWIIWPSLWMTLRNIFFGAFIVRPYYVNDFSIDAFRTGAKQALVNVSEELATGNLSKLKDRATKECLEEVMSNYTNLTLKQKTDLKVKHSDIFLSFPYQLGIIFKSQGEDKPDRVFVEVTMCYHIFRDFEAFIKEKTDGSASLPQHGPLYDQSDNISIANYRFIREVTKGVEDDWTINVINHFKPGDAIKG